MSERETLQNFLTRSLEIVRKHGNTTQLIDIEGIMPTITHYTNELYDFNERLKDPEKNPHHPINSLERFRLTSIFKIQDLISEVLRNSE